MKRLVRQRCGFGCVICGNPFYQYDHIIDYAIVQCHEADNLTLLCPNCHWKKTAKILPLSIVGLANSFPYNFISSTTGSQLLHITGNYLTVKLGGGLTYVAELIGTTNYPLVIDGVPIIAVSLENSRILLSIKLFDRNNDLIFYMFENEVFATIDVWDIEIIGNVITIREALRKIFISIELDLLNSMIRINGIIFLNGVQIDISNRDMWISGNRYADIVANRSEYGLKVEGLPDAPKFYAAFAVQLPTFRRQRIQKIVNWRTFNQ